MAQSMASFSGLRGTSRAVLEGTVHLSGPLRLTAPGGASGSRATAVRPSATIKADLESSSSTRRSVLGLVAGIGGASFATSALADAKSIKFGGPPPPSGGLPGTENSDEARDFSLPLKNRFYLQPLPPAEAAVRAKESAKEILNVKGFIEKKAWPYVQNDLRLRASYLRYDLNTVILAKPKGEKQQLKDLTGKLFDAIDGLDHAAKIKSSAEAEKYYAATKTAIDDVISKLG